MFSASAFDVAEAVDFGLLWSHLFCLFIRSFWLKLLIGKFFLCCRCFRFISSFFLQVALISTRSLFSSIFFNSFCVFLIPSDTTVCFYHVMYAFRVNLHSIIAWMSKELLAWSRWYGFYWYGFYCFRVIRFLLFSGKMLIHLTWVLRRMIVISHANYLKIFSVTTFSLLLRSKKREGDKLHCQHSPVSKLCKWTMETGNFLLNTIELPTRFARRLLQGSILCTMMIMIFLFIIILFDVIFQI